jgi:hypothetical protein
MTEVIADLESQIAEELARHYNTEIQEIFAELEAIKNRYGIPLLDMEDSNGWEYDKVKMRHTNRGRLCKNCHKLIYNLDGEWYHLDDGNGRCETPR